MIKAVGESADGVPRVLLGLTAEEFVDMAASGIAYVVDTVGVDPRLPPLQIVLIGGGADGMTDRVVNQWPGVWVMPS